MSEPEAVHELYRHPLKEKCTHSTNITKHNDELLVSENKKR